MNDRSSHHSNRTPRSALDHVSHAPRKVEAPASEAASPLYSYPIVWAAALAVILMVMLGLVVPIGGVAQPTASGTVVDAVSALGS